MWLNGRFPGFNSQCQTKQNETKPALWAYIWFTASEKLRVAVFPPPPKALSLLESDTECSFHTSTSVLLWWAAPLFIQLSKPQAQRSPSTPSSHAHKPSPGLSTLLTSLKPSRSVPLFLLHSFSSEPAQESPTTATPCSSPFSAWTQSDALKC